MLLEALGGGGAEEETPSKPLVLVPVGHHKRVELDVVQQRHNHRARIETQVVASNGLRPPRLALIQGIACSDRPDSDNDALS